MHSSDITFDMSLNTIKVHKKNVEPWKITLVDTGKLTMTGGRLKKIKDFLNNETFFMTYGDGVANININELLKFHKINKKATLTAVKPPSRFGALEINEDNLVSNLKKSQ